MLAANYNSFQQVLNPGDLLDSTNDGLTVEEELVGIIRNQALKDLSGLAVIASAQFAIGVETIDQLEPSIVGIHGECTFVGRIADIAIYDFSRAALKAGIISSSDSLVLPGLVFNTDSSLEDFTDCLGVLSLARFCAVMPGSLYELREIPHPWHR